MEPRRPFYGWWIAASTFLTLFVMVGLIYYGLPVFYTEFIREFGWSRTALTAPYAVSVLLLAPIIGLLIGSLIERYGIRRVMLTGVICATAAFFGFSRMRSLPAWFLFYFLNTVGYMFAGPIPNQVLVSLWFRRMRGRVMGMAYVGIGLGGFLAPQLVTWGSEGLGWRRTLLLGGILIGALLLPIVLFVIKQRPQDIGQEPDGEPAAGAAPAPALTLREVVRRREFWLIATGSFFSIAAIGSVIQHLKLHLVGHRFTNREAAWVASTLLISSIAGRVVMGFLADRFSKKSVMIAAYTLVGASIPLLYFVDVPKMAYAFAIIFGFGMGADYMMIPLMVAECFGAASVGRVMGFILPTDSIGQAIFPMLVGWLFDRAGNYNTAFAVMTAAGLLGVLAITLIRPPGAAREVAPETAAPVSPPSPQRLPR